MPLLLTVFLESVDVKRLQEYLVICVEVGLHVTVCAAARHGAGETRGTGGWTRARTRVHVQVRVVSAHAHASGSTVVDGSGGGRKLPAWSGDGLESPPPTP